MCDDWDKVVDKMEAEEALDEQAVINGVQRAELEILQAYGRGDGIVEMIDLIQAFVWNYEDYLFYLDHDMLAIGSNMLKSVKEVHEMDDLVAQIGAATDWIKSKDYIYKGVPKF